VKLWGVQSGALKQAITVDSDSVHTVFSVAFSPDGKTLAGDGWGNAVKLWVVNESR
jgi:WD40 repeat protein